MTTIAAASRLAAAVLGSPISESKCGARRRVRRSGRRGLLENTSRNLLRLSPLLLGAFWIGACGSIPVEERESVRKEIDRDAENTLKRVLADKPDLAEGFDSAAGYFAGRVSNVMAGVIGVHDGLGVMVDRNDGTRTYMDMEAIDFGVGLGSREYDVLAFIEDRKTLERIENGVQLSALRAETASGKKGGSAYSATALEGVSVYIVPESGAVASATAQWGTLSVNHDLTDTGLSNVSFPVAGRERPDRQLESAPRKWARVLPFFGQKVVDKGIDLPLPFGVGLVFSKVEQESDLTNFRVGINGRPKEPIQIDFVAPPRSSTEAWNLKLDAWVLPFLNVYGIIGRVKGKAPIDILLDGNEILDYFEIDCDRPLPNPLCRALEGRTIQLPTIATDIRGMNYGIGAVLAGGWRDWFAAVPVSYTFADLEGKNTEGATFTFSPRVGRLFGLGRAGNLGLFAGASYLDTSLTVSGTVSTPDGLLTFDYTVDQENLDKWNIVLGGNWDISKHWAISAEYSGFVGSRETFIASFSLSY